MGERLSFNPESANKSVESPKSFTRESIYDAFITAKRLKAEDLMLSAERSYATANQMDGKMQSRYDTQKEDHATEGALKERDARKIFDELENELERKALGTETVTSDAVGEECAVLVEDRNYKTEEWFYISNLFGGMKISLNGTEIVGISSATPFGANVIGKTVGSSFKYRVSDSDPWESFKIKKII